MKLKFIILIFTNKTNIMDLLAKLPEVQEKITLCASMQASDTCANANAQLDFYYLPIESIGIWWTSVMELMNFALTVGVEVGAGYLSYYQAKALNSLYCAGTNNITQVSNLVEAAYYVLWQVKAQYVLQEQVFFFTFPVMCTCLEAISLMSDDMIAMLAGGSGNSYRFLGKCLTEKTLDELSTSSAAADEGTNSTTTDSTTSA